MRIFFLDDDDYRHAVIKLDLRRRKADLVAVKTVAEAIRHIEKTKFDLILLDHDLDGQVFVPSGPGTGFEVAERIPASINHDTRIIVHTMNEEGAQAMLGVLGARAEWVPFPRLGDVLARL